jgi:hypothetical protein
MLCAAVSEKHADDAISHQLQPPPNRIAHQTGRGPRRARAPRPWRTVHCLTRTHRLSQPQPRPSSPSSISEPRQPAATAVRRTLSSPRCPLPGRGTCSVVVALRVQSFCRLEHAFVNSSTLPTVGNFLMVDKTVLTRFSFKICTRGLSCICLSLQPTVAGAWRYKQSKERPPTFTSGAALFFRRLTSASSAPHSSPLSEILTDPSSASKHMSRVSHPRRASIRHSATRDAVRPKSIPDAALHVGLASSSASTPPGPIARHSSCPATVSAPLEIAASARRFVCFEMMSKTRARGRF